MTAPEGHERTRLRGVISTARWCTTRSRSSTYHRQTIPALSAATHTSTWARGTSHRRQRQSRRRPLPPCPQPSWPVVLHCPISEAVIGESVCKSASYIQWRSPDISKAGPPEQRRPEERGRTWFESLCSSTPYERPGNSPRVAMNLDAAESQSVLPFNSDVLVRVPSAECRRPLFNTNVLYRRIQ